ncbi:MAG: hypothetical protein COS84_09195 [Armatimonadetes bacterium CG07_land_8_20_14_0_80_40_9]|nr:MAG: hypothetical protein COS84_09195 [Armatimonadetes bacterium CG07_land_8_20_14_0_80_40_9]
MSNLKMGTAQRITQHKRFVPSGTHPNFCFAKTSFMLGPLGEMLINQKGGCSYEYNKVYRS